MPASPTRLDSSHIREHGWIWCLDIVLGYGAWNMVLGIWCLDTGKGGAPRQRMIKHGKPLEHGRRATPSQIRDDRCLEGGAWRSKGARKRKGCSGHEKGATGQADGVSCCISRPQTTDLYSLFIKQGRLVASIWRRGGRIIATRAPSIGLAGLPDGARSKPSQSDQRVTYKN